MELTLNGFPKLPPASFSIKPNKLVLIQTQSECQSSYHCAPPCPTVPLKREKDVGQETLFRGFSALLKMWWGLRKPRSFFMDWLITFHMDWYEMKAVWSQLPEIGFHTAWFTTRQDTRGITNVSLKYNYRDIEFLHLYYSAFTTDTFRELLIVSNVLRDWFIMYYPALLMGRRVLRLSNLHWFNKHRSSIAITLSPTFSSSLNSETSI